jgi:hypothetical protein
MLLSTEKDPSGLGLGKSEMPWARMQVAKAIRCASRLGEMVAVGGAVGFGVVLALGGTAVVDVTGTVDGAVGGSVDGIVDGIVVELTAGGVVEEVLGLAATGRDDGLPQAAKARVTVSNAPKTRAGLRPECAFRVSEDATWVM